MYIKNLLWWIWCTRTVYHNIIQCNVCMQKWYYGMMKMVWGTRFVGNITTVCHKQRSQRVCTNVHLLFVDEMSDFFSATDAPFKWRGTHSLFSSEAPNVLYNNITFYYYERIFLSGKTPVDKQTTKVPNKCLDTERSFTSRNDVGYLVLILILGYYK